MKRYNIDGNKIRRDNRGSWVQYKDVQGAIEEAMNERNTLREALVEIATIPLSLPNSAAGIKRAQQALDSVRSSINDII
jgi:hypothetical protein